MNNFFKFHEGKAPQLMNRKYYRSTWEKLQMETFRLLPFQIPVDSAVYGEDKIFHVQNGVETEITEYIPDFVGAAVKSGTVRNVELDQTLSPSEETAITVTAVDTGSGTITFSTLPEGFGETMAASASDYSWLALNLDNFNVGGFTLSGDYTQMLKVTGVGSALNEFTVTAAVGTLASWDVGDQVMFWNPHQLQNFNGNNDSDLDSTDFPTLAPDYVAPGAVIKKSDGTYFAFVLLWGSSGYDHSIASATANSPTGPWTAVDAHLIEPTVISSDYTSVVMDGSAIYLEDEGLYVTALSFKNGVTGKYHISVVKYDEDFSTVTYYDKMLEEDSTFGCIGSIAKFNDEWHLFYTYRTTSLNSDADPWLFKHRKTTAYNSSDYSAATTLLTGSGTGGSDADLRNKFYNSHADMNCPFEYNGEFIVIVGGTSRHNEAGNRSNRNFGIFKFDPDTNAFTMHRSGMSIVNFLGGIWPTTTWGKDHSGRAMAHRYDPTTNKHYLSMAMNNGTDTYRAKFFEFEMTELDKVDGRIIYDGSVLYRSLPRGECYFKILRPNGETYYSDLCDVGGVNSIIRHWTPDSSDIQTSGQDIISIEGNGSVNAQSNVLDIKKGETLTIIFEQTAGPELTINDWYLPARNDFNYIYTNLFLEGLGNFESARYWSSTEVDATTARVFDFSVNTGYFIAKSTDTYNVRPVRTFTAAAGVYSLGDTGPSGGLIYYVNETNYWEAAPADISTGYAWSNVDSTEIGATAQSTSILDGITNTEAIIGQAGHTDSAAKLCDEYSITIDNILLATLYDSDGVANTSANPVNVDIYSGEINRNYTFTLTPTKSIVDGYVIVNRSAGTLQTFAFKLWDAYKSYSNKLTKIVVTSPVDFGGLKYVDGWTQWIYKNAPVTRSPRAEITQIGDDVNGVIAIEKRISAVRHVMRCKVTEPEFEAFVHSISGEITVTDHTGKQYTATKVELSDPEWVQGNGIVELSFVDQNNINVYTLNNSAL